MKLACGKQYAGTSSRNRPYLMVRNQDTRHGGFCMKLRQLLTFGLLVGALGSGWASPAKAQATAEAKVAALDENNICSGDTQRVLVPGTLKIYYMKGYGAIEMGVHRFLHPKTEAENGTGEGSFVHLWRYKDGAWKVTRVLSYDHHSVGPKN